MTDFVLDAADKEAMKATPTSPTTVFRGVPTFFRALCATASQGGANSYREVGWHLGLHTVDLLMQVDEASEWEEKLEELAQLVENDDSDGVIVWYEREFPKCLQLVPPRRRTQFAEGIYRISEERNPFRDY